MLRDGDSLLAQGIVDSVGTLEKILFLVQGFGVTVTDEDVRSHSQDSVNRRLAFVERNQKDTCRE